MAPTTREKNLPPVDMNGGGNEPAIEVADEPGASEIEIGDPPPADKQDKEPPRREPEPGIEELRRQLAEAQSRADSAESRARNLEQQRQRDTAEVADSRVLVIGSKIESSEQKLADLKRQITEAKQAGDYATETDLQANMAEVVNDLKQLRLGKARLESEIEVAKTDTPASDAEAVEKMIADGKITPKSANWLRRHPDFVTDSAKNDSMMKAHMYAIGSGAVVETDDYFRIIEERLGLRQPEDDQIETDPEPKPQRRSAAPAAPVSRSGTVSGGGKEVYPGIFDKGGGKFTVNDKVREAAEISGLTLEEYVKQAVQLQRGSDGQMH